MGDIMRPVPFKDLVRRIFEEYGGDKSIFGLPESSFFRKASTKTASLFGQTIETPLGPAAGPHTQLAQNIVTSYLAGSRFIELKTVQENEPPVEKPCIDAADEGFNTEWSSEYTVEGAYAEYIKAWILLHLLEETFQTRIGTHRSFIFNMSVGYNLEGIKSRRMDAYINNLIDASKHPLFLTYLAELEELLAQGELLYTAGLGDRLESLKGLTDRISPQVCQSVTLSTMHGCPPEEIEKICVYMLTEKQLATYVKLNPTLLSYPTVRNILDGLGYDYVELREESFQHDLQYKDAIPMLSRLKALADSQNLFFGVKLTNTLGAVNFKGELPGGEMYMSGRALFPLAINVAARICQEFDGRLPISFSAGISEHNFDEVFTAGIKPITLATELLKPGGYSRLTTLAAKAEELNGWNTATIDVAKITALAEKALTASYARKDYRGDNQVRLAGKLPLFDCAEAPCKMACPIHQDIPEYIRLISEKRYSDALALIYEKNALPSITGHICDHACQYNCTRLDYEGSVLIREMKRIAFKEGFADYIKKWLKPNKQRDVKIAVLGAGPSGLASAYFLAKEGFSVTVFERRQSAGGTVRHIIPRFRISDEVIQSDIDFIKAHGVDFVFNCPPDLTPETLQAQGYKYTIIAVGAAVEKAFPLSTNGMPRILSALDFLEQFNRDPLSLHLGKHIAVVGAGNTAMDAARTALQVPGAETSTILYRRTEKEMPAYQEEYELALADKVRFQFLTHPEEYHAEGQLICRIMKLGDPDDSGRRKPLMTDRTVSMSMDTLITAIGEDVDYTLLQRLGLNKEAIQSGNGVITNRPGVYLVGDALLGPSSIVKCIANGREAADAISLAEEQFRQQQPTTPAKATSAQVKRIAAKKLGLSWQAEVPSEGDRAVDLTAADREANRCLECNYVCNKCVEVCPNRANIAVHSKNNKLANYYQIVHLDAYCNECGNCATFCPWHGKPYMDKATLFSTRKDFLESTNPGFFVTNIAVQVRLNGVIYTLVRENGQINGDGYDVNLAYLAALCNQLITERPALFSPIEAEEDKKC